MATRDLTVKIIGDSRSLERAFTRSSKSATGFAKNLKGAQTAASATGATAATAFLGVSGPAAAAAVAIGLSAKAFRDSVKAASDLNEQVNKSRAVFGASSTVVERWAKTTAGSIGIARAQALEATGTFGNLFNTVGITGDKAADMSKALVQLAADLASFNNASPTETLDAIRSGLIGEAEPLRRYGVLLSEARVQQQAMSDTGKKTAASLTDQEKALARYEIILRDTGKAQGDFERTSGGLANQQRILRARLADTSAELGGRLLPLELKAVTIANDLAAAIDGVDASLADLNSADFRQKFADAFGLDALNDVIVKLGPQLNQLAKKFQQDVQGVPLTVRVETPAGTPSFGQPGFKPGKAPAVPLGASVEQRNKIFDNAISRALERGQSDDPRKQLVALQNVAKTLAARIAITKDITRKLNLEDQLLSVNRQSKSLQDQIAKDFAERVAATAQARQFKALGLGATGGDIIPGVGNLRKQLASLTERLGSSSVNLSSKLQSQLAGVRKVLSGELGKTTEESRRAIAELFDTIRGEFEKGQGPLTKTSGLDTKKVLAGLGLDPEEIGALRGRLSGFNSAGRGLAPTVGRRGQVVESHVVVQVDGKTVGQVVTRSQQKKRRRNPPQRRGPNRPF